MKFVKSLTAALLCMLLVCSLGVSAFAYNDVTLDDEATPYIEYVDRLGILTATWNGDFKPEQYLTRADAIIAIYKMLYGKEIDASLYADSTIAFVESGDTGDINEKSVLKAYLTWANDNFLVSTNVKDAKFAPAEAITANEFMTLLAKTLRLVEDADATYPDDYTSAVADLVGDIEPGNKPVTRKQAAVALANAIVSADGVAGELGVYTDYDGKPTDSLAVKVFNMSSIELVIRATKNKSLGYNVKNGTLLSNGVDVDLSQDLSDYVGYGIVVTYRDSDNSSTYTEDEELLTYSISSTVCTNVTLDKLSISSGNSISVTGTSASYNIGTSTYLYLNDDVWPLDDEKYDLVKLIPAIGRVTSITNRSNLQFKCMAAKADDTYLATVFATEYKPGKIVGINKSYYSVYDYYYAGTDQEIKTYHISDCVLASGVQLSVGTYVNFYESSSKCYFTPGTTILSGVWERINGGYTLSGGKEVMEHAFYRTGDCALQFDPNEETATKYQLIVDNSGSNLLITWESYKTNYAQMKITGIVTSGNSHKITATKLSDNSSVTFDVLFDNVDSTTALAVGDFIDYSDNGAQTPVVYVRKASPITADVTNCGEYFMTNDGKNTKYYKNAYFTDESGFTTGNATLYLDMANTVVAIVAK